MTVFTAAASVVVVVGLAGLAVTQGITANHLRVQRDQLSGFADFLNQPGATRTAVGDSLTAVARPGVRDFYIRGVGVPDPAPGNVYRVWLASGSTFRYVGAFRPDQGLVLIELAFDPSQFDRIVITEEPESSAPTQPQDVRWSSAA